MAAPAGYSSSETSLGVDAYSADVVTFDGPSERDAIFDGVAQPVAPTDHPPGMISRIIPVPRRCRPRSRNRDDDDRREDDDQGSPTCVSGNSSFLTGTLVAMAGGSSPPIEHIEPDNLGIAANPHTGERVKGDEAGSSADWMSASRDGVRPEIEGDQ
jgi:hypothetical protein